MRGLDIPHFLLLQPPGLLPGPFASGAGISGVISGSDIGKGIDLDFQVGDLSF